MARNKKVIYLSALIATAGAFLVDRLFLGEPEPAVAETASGQPSSGRPRRPKTARPPKQQEVADPSLPWLERLAEARAARDVFSPPGGMLAHYRRLEANKQKAEQTGPQPGSPELFEDQHELQATFVSHELMIAVVDGNLLRLGGKLDDYRLTRIEPYRAEFRRGRDRASLIIPEPISP